MKHVSIIRSLTFFEMVLISNGLIENHVTQGSHICHMMLETVPYGIYMSHIYGIILTLHI